MVDAVIVGAVRTAVGKAPTGSLRSTRPDELAARCISELLKRTEGMEAADIEDVILGCAMPEAEQGLNVARIASLRAGIPVEASAVTVNRFCASGLQAIAFAADRIKAGSAKVVVAGGTESMRIPRRASLPECSPQNLANSCAVFAGAVMPSASIFAFSTSSAMSSIAFVSAPARRSLKGER